MITNILKTIEQLSKVKDKTLVERALKLSEENGELSQAILCATGVHGCEYKGLTMEDVKEECVDVALVDLSIFFQAGGTVEELANTLLYKIEKWQRVTKVEETK